MKEKAFMTHCFGERKSLFKLCAKLKIHVWYGSALAIYLRPISIGSLSGQLVGLTCIHCATQSGQKIKAKLKFNIKGPARGQRQRFFWVGQMDFSTPSNQYHIFACTSQSRCLLRFEKSSNSNDTWIRYSVTDILCLWTFCLWSTNKIIYKMDS